VVKGGGYLNYFSNDACPSNELEHFHLDLCSGCILFLGRESSGTDDCWIATSS
jgi:hypothetical protein